MKKNIEFCFKDCIFRSYHFPVEVTIKASSIKCIFQHVIIKTPFAKFLKVNPNSRRNRSWFIICIFFINYRRKSTNLIEVDSRLKQASERKSPQIVKPKTMFPQTIVDVRLDCKYASVICAMRRVISHMPYIICAISALHSARKRERVIEQNIRKRKCKHFGQTITSW